VARSDAEPEEQSVPLQDIPSLEVDALASALKRVLARFRSTAPNCALTDGAVPIVGYFGSRRCRISLKNTADFSNNAAQRA
jgi:hypothetical protein